MLQLIVAGIISAVYGLVMIVVLVGIMIQITEDGWVAPSTILFFVVGGQLVVAGLLHPQEWACLLCGLIYYVTVPSMYMLLIVFSLFNVNNVTWGTRDSKTPAAVTVIIQKRSVLFFFCRSTFFQEKQMIYSHPSWVVAGRRTEQGRRQETQRKICSQ